MGNKFKLVTDHKILKWIFVQPNLNMRQRRWIELLQEYDFDIVYIPGKENVIADALSRKSFIGAISIPSNPILDLVKDSIPLDPEYQQMVDNVKSGGQTEAQRNLILNYATDGDCLYYRQRLCIPKDAELKR